jgi:hypothetical protein
MSGLPEIYLPVFKLRRIQTSPEWQAAKKEGLPDVDREGPLWSSL